MDQSGSVTRLARDLRSDNPHAREEAARQIWDRHFGRLLALARRHLDARVRVREDEEDVLQSMYKSFCCRQQRGDFDIADRDALWNVLVTITLNKARNVANRHRSRRRDVRLEWSATGPGEEGSSSPHWSLEQMEASEPTPAEASELCEELQRRLRCLEDPALRRIALWKLEGYTNAEIAPKLGCTERTVERKLERIRERWSRGEDGLA
jgi:RNA polymerase sigma factor (sigma-70 family)